MKNEQIPELRETKRGKHPNSLKALESNQFQKGQSGNPSGKPKLKEFAKKLSEYGDRMLTMDSVDAQLWNNGVAELGTSKDLVIEKIWELAVKGDKDMIKLLIQLGCFK